MFQYEADYGVHLIEEPSGPHPQSPTTGAEFVHRRAIAVFGTRKAADEWFGRPACALGGRRPLDVMSIEGGLELVSDALGRIEYGVYT